MKLDKFLKRMSQAVLEAGQLAREKQEGVVNIGKEVESLPEDTAEVHAARSAKTIIDERVQELLLKAAAAVLDPKSIKLDAEEETPSTKLFPNKESEITLVIDPIDGTTQYIDGTDQYSICVGLLERGKILTALVYFPKRRLFYFIGTDGKAYLSKDGSLSSAQELITQIPSDEKAIYINYRVPNEIKQHLMEHGYKVTEAQAGWSEGLLQCLSGEFVLLVLHTIQVRDVLLGAILAITPGGYAVDWKGKTLVWPPGGRIPRVMFGVGNPPKEILDCLKD